MRCFSWLSLLFCSLVLTSKTVFSCSSRAVLSILCLECTDFSKLSIIFFRLVCVVTSVTSNLLCVAHSVLQSVSCCHVRFSVLRRLNKILSRNSSLSCLSSFSCSFIVYSSIFIFSCSSVLQERNCLSTGVRCSFAYTLY